MNARAGKQTKRKPSRDGGRSRNEFVLKGSEIMIVTFHKLEDEFNDFAYGEDEQGHLIGGKLADDVQYIYKTLSDDYERYYGIVYAWEKLNLGVSFR